MSNARLTELVEDFTEGLTGYVGTITSDHAYIHQGIAFKHIGTTTIAGSGAYKFSFVTPDATDPATGEQKYIHWRPAKLFSVSGAFDAVLYEGSSTVSGGSAGSVVNLNRNSTKTANLAVTDGVTVGADGTAIQYLASGTAGVPTARAGGGASADQEIVLKPNTTYTMTITDITTANNDVYWEFFWYEEAST